MVDAAEKELIGFIPIAGKGERMLPLTAAMPKALINIFGKSLLERAIDTLIAYGIRKVVIVTGYMKEKIRDYIKTRDFDIQVELVNQEQQLGLADAILVSRNCLKNDFVMLCPDSLYSDYGDFGRAMDAFIRHKPVALQATAAAPVAQEGRQGYPSGDFKNVAPNLFVNIRGCSSNTGLVMHSTGIVFFSKRVLDYLLSASGVCHDSAFPRFMRELKDRADFMAYLIRGTRYDFTQPDDIGSYVSLQESFAHTADLGVSVILLNKQGEVLLQLRDNMPTIRYPNHWALFGGSINKNETAYQCIEREVKEEISYELQNYGLFREFVQNNKREYAFVGEISANLDSLTLGEGQKMGFFSPRHLKNLTIRPDDLDTLRAYYGSSLL